MSMGDGYAYDIGDLSAAGLGHSSEKINAKYKQWAEALFVSYLAHAPVIKSEVRFWRMAWSNAKLASVKIFAPLG